MNFGRYILKSLIVENSGICVELNPYEIKFTKDEKDIAPTFYIPKQFADIAIEFYDLLFEDKIPTAIIACRKGYDIALNLNEKTGRMTNWHYTK